MGLKKQAGLNSYILTAKPWVEKTNAIGLISKSCRDGTGRTFDQTEPNRH